MCTHAVINALTRWICITSDHIRFVSKSGAKLLRDDSRSKKKIISTIGDINDAYERICSFTLFVVNIRAGEIISFF